MDKTRQNLSQEEEARRIRDRIVIFKVSPFKGKERPRSPSLGGQRETEFSRGRFHGIRGVCLHPVVVSRWVTTGLSPTHANQVGNPGGACARGKEGGRDGRL